MSSIGASNRNYRREIMQWLEKNLYRQRCKQSHNSRNKNKEKYKIQQYTAITSWKVRFWPHTDAIKASSNSICGHKSNFCRPMSVVYGAKGDRTRIVKKATPDALIKELLDPHAGEFWFWAAWTVSKCPSIRCTQMQRCFRSLVTKSSCSFDSANN